MRQVLTVLLPLLLPLLAYFLYARIAQHRAQQAGQSPPSPWRDMPWPWILLAGCVLMTASLLFFEQQQGYDAGTELTPPTWVDGEIVPSHPVEDQGEP